MNLYTQHAHKPVLLRMRLLPTPEQQQSFALSLYAAGTRLVSRSSDWLLQDAAGPACSVCPPAEASPQAVADPRQGRVCVPAPVGRDF